MSVAMQGVGREGARLEGVPSSVFLWGVPEVGKAGERGRTCLAGLGGTEIGGNQKHGVILTEGAHPPLPSPPISGLWEWGWPVAAPIPASPPIPAARDLLIEDQISLLKGAAFELCQLRFNTVFNAETGTWECGRLSYCLEDPAGAQEPPAALAEGGNQPEGERSHARMCLSWDHRAGGGRPGTGSSCCTHPQGASSSSCWSRC